MPTVHTPQIIQVKELNDENIAYLVRCCSDPKTDSWITISVHVADSDCTASLQAHKDQIADRHAKKLSRLAQAASLVGN